MNQSYNLTLFCGRLSQTLCQLIQNAHMYDRKHCHRILDKLRSRVAIFSENHGFHPVIKKNWTGKSIEDTWEKNNNWQKTKIRTLFSPYNSGLTISFSVYLLVEEGRGILFDGQNLEYLAHKKYQYKFPNKAFGFFLNKRIDSFLNNIDKDLSQEFAWFYGRDTPEKCINILTKEKQEGKQNRNGFGLSYYNEAIQFLGSINNTA